MRDTINLIIQVFEKATITVTCETSIQSKWRIRYDIGALSEWKISNTSFLLNSGIYEIEFSDEVGYNKPDNYICFLKPGQIKKIGVIYTKEKTSDLQISFFISKFYQKYLSWKLTRLNGPIIIDWNHNINYKENLPNGKYQIQITGFKSNPIPQNIKFYNLQGLEVSDYEFIISEEIYNFDLESTLIVSRTYNRL